MTEEQKRNIYLWWNIVKGGNELVEIRVIGKRTYSGYYKDVENIIRDVERFDSDPDSNIYFTLNAVKGDCYGRQQCEFMVQNPKNTTSDSDICGRRFILIDLDPKRSAGTNSSDEEFMAAYRKALEVYTFLKEQGFNESVVARSGNGYHLLVPVKIGISDETTLLVKRFLSTLSMLFSDDVVDVDEKVFNPARICKLYGTVAKKGANIPGRPWRMSEIVKYPAEIEFNTIEYIRKVADMYPEEEVSPNRHNNYSTEKFDVESFLQRNGIKYNRQTISGGVKYILDHCVFDESHKGKDAVIFQRDNGAIAYVCLHNSCSHRTWRDVRLKFEPDAYDKKEYDEYRYRQRYYGGQQYQKTAFEPQKETDDKGKKWLSMSDIKYVDVSEMVAIPTGFFEFDKKIMGLLLGDMTILSGLSGSGKTSIIDSMLLNIVQRGYKCGVFSGELQDFRFQSWISQIAAGKSFVLKKEGYDGIYYCPRKYVEKISKWLDGKLFLYNNNYGNKWEQLFSDIKDLVENNGVQLVVLDNLMTISIDGYDGDKFSKQTQFVNDVKEYAKLKNIHVIIVCHPRKEGGFLRMESISGTADITNLADNVFILHRVGRDFETRGGEFLGKEKVIEYMCYDTVIEIAKNRSVGVKDVLIGLYYERESRRLKNEVAENIIYGWNDIEDEEPQMTVYYEMHPNTSFDDNSSYNIEQYENQQYTEVEEEYDDLPF